MLIRVADGPAQRIGGRTAQHVPGEEAWLIGEHRSTGERKYYLSKLPADTSLRLLAAAIKARWVCEQAHQQLGEKLGLDHFEGRSWTGLHRHALMAYAFLQSRRLRAVGRKKRATGPPPQPSLPAIRQAILDSRTLRSTAESGPRAEYDEAKRKKGSKLHMAVDTFGHLLALHITPANRDDRVEVGRLAAAIQEVTEESVELAYVD